MPTLPRSRRRATAGKAFGLDIPPQARSGAPRDSVDVIREAVDEEPQRADDRVAGAIDEPSRMVRGQTRPATAWPVRAMAVWCRRYGPPDHDGLDADDALEWNAYADPSAVSATHARMYVSSSRLVYATDDVPVERPDRAARSRPSGGADLGVYELLVRNPERLRPEPGQQLWDEPAALAPDRPRLKSAGRTPRSPPVPTGA